MDLDFIVDLYFCGLRLHQRYHINPWQKNPRSAEETEFYDEEIYENEGNEVPEVEVQLDGLRTVPRCAKP